MLRVSAVTTWLFVCFFASAFAAGAKTLEERDVGDWHLVAFASESGNAGAACYVIGASISGGQILSLFVDQNHEWFLVIANEKWVLDADAERDLTYAVDGGPPTAAMAHAFGPTMLRIALGVSFDATEPLRRGNRLEIRYQKGGQASFSLKGSSNALDALLACATRHLGYQDSPDIVRIGSWLVLRKPHEDGSCRAATAGDNDTLFTFSYDKAAGYFIRISHLKHQWQLRDGQHYVLSYRVDGGAPVETYAGASGNTVLLLIGKDFETMLPFANGHTLQVEAARQNLTVDLRDAGRALDALRACAQGLAAEGKAMADPFSSSAEAATGSTHSGSRSADAPEEVMPSVFPPLSGQKARVFLPEAIGTWDITASDDFSGAFSDCTIFAPHKAGDPTVTFDLDRDREWGITFTETDWKLETNQPATLRAIVDATEPVIMAGKSLGSDMIKVELGKDPPLATALRAGRRVTFEVNQKRFTIDLAGAGVAFDALEHCTAKLSAESASPAPGEPTADDKALDDRDIDYTMRGVKLLRMAIVIFANDASAEGELRERLRFALTSKPSGADRTEIMQAVVQAFLAGYLEKAMKAAPPEALAKLVKHDRDVMQELREQPRVCAAFFKATGTGDFSFLSPEMRLAQGEAYADIIEAAMLRPEPSADPVSDEQAATWMAQAYTAQGFAVEDIAKLADVWILDDPEVCRLGNQFMMALSTLSDTQASRLYRSMSP